MKPNTMILHSFILAHYVPVFMWWLLNLCFLLTFNGINSKLINLLHYPVLSLLLVWGCPSTTLYDENTIFRFRSFSRHHSVYWVALLIINNIIYVIYLLYTLLVQLNAVAYTETRIFCSIIYTPTQSLSWRDWMK